jgi:hypothetical protein
VNGERGNVGRADDPADRELRPELIPPLLKPVSEHRRGQRSIDETGGDEVDANRRELKREGGRKRG